MGIEGVREDLRFEVADWFAWAPSLENRAAWRDWAGAPVAANDSEPLPVKALDVRQFQDRLATWKP